jgi:exopolysaccharide biosynthesis protein
MKSFFLKPYRWAAFYSVVLVGLLVFSLLHTFVIPQSLETVASASAQEAVSQIESTSQTKAITTENSYDDGNIKINIDTVVKYDTTFYIADIQVSDPSYLKTALAGNTYGRNVKKTTSAMAEQADAIFAINGDYYGFRDTGYVLRNGVAYRETGNNSQALAIDKDGNLSIIDESRTTMSSLVESGTWQVLSFGPALMEDGLITVDGSSEVSQSKSSNPRTAIGQISALHYVIIVSDGRTDESAGLSLLELAEEFEARGCSIAYNLDGGGSSTMYFNGEIVNNPTDGRTLGEREVSDIVYFGY